MGGTNPYIEAPKVRLPEKKYTITFEGEHGSETVEVDPARIPYGETGLPGSILDIALASGIDMDHACGGVCAYSTCHVYVKSGMESCSEATEAEQDMLDMAPEVRPSSRLACQCVPSGEKSLTVKIPSWNRNLAREGQ